MATESQGHKLNTEIDEISLKELILKMQEWWRYLLSKWLVILVFGLIGGALGFIYAKSKEPIYTASTTFVSDDEKGRDLGSLSGLASVAGFTIGGGSGGIFAGDNILSLYKSRTMLQKTLLTLVSFDGKKQLLVDQYITFNGLRKNWADKPALANLRFSKDSLRAGDEFANQTRLRDSLLGVIVNDIDKNYLTVTKPDKESSTIEVSVKAKDEYFAKNFNDELVKNVNEFYIETTTKKTLQNVRILQQKADSVRAVMNRAIYRAVQVGDETPNLNPTRQIQRVAPAQKAQFSAETNKAVLAELVKTLELTKMSLLKETPLIQIVDEPILPLKKEQLGNLKAIVIGAMLFMFLTSLILIVKNLLKMILS